MALPERYEGYTVQASDWNAHVHVINSNTNRIDQLERDTSAGQITGVRLRRSTSQSFSSFTWTKVVFDTEVYQATDISWDGAGDVTAQLAGLYAVSGWFRNTGGNNVDRYVAVYVNGTQVNSSSVASSANVSTADFIPLQSGDVVSAYAFDEGGNPQLVAGTPHMSVFRIGSV